MVAISRIRRIALDRVEADEVVRAGRRLLPAPMKAAEPAHLGGLLLAFRAAPQGS